MRWSNRLDEADAKAARDTDAERCIMRLTGGAIISSVPDAARCIMRREVDEETLLMVPNKSISKATGVVVRRNNHSQCISKDKVTRRVYYHGECLKFLS
jgi:hypothetical protein